MLICLGCNKPLVPAGRKGKFPVHRCPACGVQIVVKRRRNGK